MYINIHLDSELNEECTDIVISTIRRMFLFLFYFSVCYDFDPNNYFDEYKPTNLIVF